MTGNGRTGTNGQTRRPSGNGAGASTDSGRMSIAELTPADYNPRTISEAALKGLAASIDRFGLVQPIIWNKRTDFEPGTNFKA